MKLKRNKIRRSREQLIFYLDLLNGLCEKYNLDYYSFMTQRKPTAPLKLKRFVHYMILVNKIDTDEFKPDGIYRTKYYGSDLNAIGDVIRWVERNYGNG